MIERGADSRYYALMKRIVIAPLLLGWCFVAMAIGPQNPQPAATPQPLPTPFPEARYRLMSEKSPFAVATDTTAASAPTPGFAAQLYVDGVARVGNTDFVVIKSRDEDDKHPPLFLEVGKSSPDGIKVEGIKWSDKMGESTVAVSKGGEKATLLFDEDSIKNAPDQGQPQGRPGFLNGPPRPVFHLPNGGYNPRGVLPNNGQIQPTQPGGQRRIRGVIQGP